MMLLNLGSYQITWAEYFERAKNLNQKLALAQWAQELTDKERKIDDILHTPGGLAQIAAAMTSPLASRVIYYPSDMRTDNLGTLDLPIYDRDLPNEPR